MKKVILFFVGMLLIALGTVINTKTGLGNSAVGSLPFIISKITNLSLGLITNIIYVIFIILQIIILRKFDKVILLQIPITILFGLLLDAINLLWFININNIFLSLLFLLISIICISLGMYLVLKQKIAYNTPDGLVNAISVRYSLSKGFSKNILDIILVALSIIISYIYFNKIIGVGIGTICAVILIGRGIGLFEKIFGGIK